MKKHYLLLLALSLSPSVSMANVVVNGTFDNNTTGWAGSYSAQVGGSGGFPSIDTGSYYFGGQNASNIITQIYNLTNFDLNSLSSAGLNFTMSADLFGWETHNDHSIFKASFYSNVGASGSLLGSIALDSATNDPGTWPSIYTAGDFPNFQTTTGKLSNLTTSILFTVESLRLQGADNDGYADNLNFSLSPVTTVPLPDAVWLFGSGLLGLFGMKKKS